MRLSDNAAPEEGQKFCPGHVVIHSLGRRPNRNARRPDEGLSVLSKDGLLARGNLLRGVRMSALAALGLAN
jgi:hypothetical protein